MSGRDRKQVNVKGDYKTVNKPSNVGPAGISKPEYTHGKDHIDEYLAFKEKWIAYVTTTFDSDLESIVTHKRKPSIPPLDVEALKPKEYNEKDQVQVLIFETELRAMVTKRLEKSIRLEEQYKTYYNTLWQQLSISFQNYISQLNDFKISSENKRSEWLWAAYESACHGVLQLDKDDALSSALLILTGLKKRKFESIHGFYLRWNEAYNAYVQSEGAELSESVKINLFNSCLDEVYKDFKAEMKNKKTFKERTPVTLEENYQVAATYVAKATVTSNGEQRAVYYTADEALAKSKVKRNSGNKDPKQVRKTRAEWLKTVICHLCRKPGHLMKICP